jgi:hypothetical protein
MKLNNNEIASAMPIVYFEELKILSLDFNRVT